MTEALRWTFSHWRGVALLRALWWRHVRRYAYEVCDHCGQPVGRCTGSWWRAPELLWLKVNRSENGVLCPPCFTARADALGLAVHWEAVIEESWPALWQCDACRACGPGAACSECTTLGGDEVVPTSRKGPQ